MPEAKEREKLAEAISQWNSDRLDLFEISQPDEDLVFHGVIRFSFEDHKEEGSVATKCLRVCSSLTTREVIETLSEKFRPDMKMLSTKYSLYEIHADQERRLDLDERPLVVQLSWTSDNREGQFVLKKDQERLEESYYEKEKEGLLQTIKRTLSRKGKKKEESRASGAERASEGEDGPAEDLLNNSDRSSSLEPLRRCEKHKRNQIPEDSSDQPGLPVRVKICDDAEEPFLSAVINYTNSSTVHFKLSPAYTLYAASRFALRRRRSGGSPSSASTHPVTSITNKMATMMGKVIQRHRAVAGVLAFWLANSSELLNFLKNDKDLGPFTKQSQLDLSHQVHNAYSFLLRCLQGELRKHLPTFLTDPERHGALPAGIEMVLDTLMNAMSLLRRCRVSPALTIQLFSQLFHFISAWLFNQLMAPEPGTPGLRSHYWGAALRQRLTPIEAWAERQGLELAADCHLGHITQATTLLTMNKYSASDAKDIQTSCFKLNSLQLRMLMDGYMYGPSEPQIPPDLTDAVAKAAKASADSLIHSDGGALRATESLDLLLPFLLPQGGYSCETLRGVPQGFREFLEPICQKGLCCLTSVADSQGDWTLHFTENTHTDGDFYLAAHRQPEVEKVTLHKPLNSGMGVSIVAAKGAGQSDLGIYVKSVVRGGPAEMSGKLAAGDQLLSVDGHSLVGLSQDSAAAIMMRTGPVVSLQVEKFAAIYRGLGNLLNESSPENETSSSHLRLDGVSTLYCVVDLSPSERNHGGRKRNKDQRTQKYRQLYRSDPNVTAGFCPEDQGELFDPGVRGNGFSSVSSDNLCADTHPREYLTLPNSKSQDKSDFEPKRPTQPFTMAVNPSSEQSDGRRGFMRHAVSQESLCADAGGPLLGQKQNALTQRNQSSSQSTNFCRSVALRSSVSTHYVPSDRKQPPRSPAGVWRNPFSQQATPTPSVRPIRIDIPVAVSRAGGAQSNPPLTTFQPSPSVLNRLRKASEQTKSSPSRACPSSAAKALLQPLVLWQQQRSEKPRLCITPTKPVSFQEPPSERKGSGPGGQSDPQVLLRGPWRREVQEVVERLEREARQLRAKEQQSDEEDRLRRLDLEWRFQKRVQEIQQRGEGEEEEEEEDLDVMMILQQLDRTSENKIGSVGNINRKQNEEEKHGGNQHSYKQEGKPDHRENGLKAASDEKPAEKIKMASAPEKLTLRERRRLFSLATSA
ncbi:afadin-like [Xiphophorus maculatus]|uniref:afadin-like n=1 Tax=Xiphophorus maculatus TaxID=8083 RepID=UPI000C6E17A0|nr:afadin-like [Xiphophorus maculatus]